MLAHSKPLLISFSAVKPEAELLSVVSSKNVIATKVEFKNNKCTGEFIPPSALGEGKLKLVQSWMKDKQRNSFSRVTFYSDSINDLPLLEAVELPIAVNPDQTLDGIARDRGWKIITLPRI